MFMIYIATNRYTTVTQSGKASQKTFINAKMSKGGDMYDIYSTYMSHLDSKDFQCDAVCQHFWIAVDDSNKVLGCVGVIMSTYDTTATAIYESPQGDSSMIPPKKVCELVRMSVSEDARGKGIASKLYNVLESFAREKGMQRIVLSTLEDMLLAVGLYKKLGYRLLMKTSVDIDFFRHVAVEEGFEPDDVVVVHYGKDI